jgi:hypothetical protein
LPVRPVRFNADGTILYVDFTLGLPSNVF